MTQENNYLFDKNIFGIIKKFNTFESFREAFIILICSNHVNTIQHFVCTHPPTKGQIIEYFHIACELQNKQIADIFANNIDICDALCYLCHHKFSEKQSDLTGIKFITNNYKSHIENSWHSGLTCLLFFCKARDTEYFLDNIDTCYENYASRT